MPSIAKRERSDNFYRELQDRTLHRLQELSGKVWTDFNVHDPGVTIADYMNYALFELHYKLGLPFEAYLGADTAGYGAMGIFSAETLFSHSIVTPHDYEVLLTESIRELESCHVEVENSRYRIFASCPPREENSENAIAEKIFRVYHAHRNLGEDLDRRDITVTNRSSAHKKHGHFEDILPVKKLALPEAPPVNVPAYRSFQYDFPENYGIGPRGLSQSAMAPRRAQALQLKSYLLLADFMLSDATAQVRGLPQLIRFGDLPAGTTPMVEIPDVRRVVDSARFGSEGQLRTADDLQSKRSGYLDLLDTLYGEDTARFFSEYRGAGSQNAYRAALVQALPGLNRDRFRSFDKLRANSSPVIADLAALLTGSEKNSGIPLHELLARFGLDLLSDSNFFGQYDVYLNLSPITGVFYTPIFNEEPEEVEYRETVWKDVWFDQLREQISLLRRNAVFESFLLYGAAPAHYRQIRLTETDRHMLVFRYPGKSEWMVMGVFRSEEELTRAANKLWAFIRLLDPDRRLLYVIEHDLLKTANPGEKEEAGMLSVVSGGNHGNSQAREKLDMLLAERLPAHLQVRIFHIKPDYLYDFARIYHKWRNAMANEDERDTVLFSESIRAFFRVSHDAMNVIR
jgi:hypothetical protein